MSMWRKGRAGGGPDGRFGPRTRLGVSLTGALLLVAGAVAPALSAEVVPPGTFQEITNGLEVNGDWTTAGNGLLTCGPDCNGGANNFSFNTYADVDSDSTTFNSSSANLTIPAGAQVVKAWLMWSAPASNGLHCPGGTSGLPNPSTTTEQVEATTPVMGIDGGAYTNVGAADYLSQIPFDNRSTQINGAVDVTAELASLTSGTHEITVGNVPSANGRACFAGWSLHVAYDYGRYIPGNADSALRKLYTGFGGDYVFAENKTVNYSGFKTVADGATMVLTVLDGENDAGDSAQLSWAGGNELLSGPDGTTSNVFRSRADGAIPYVNVSAADFQNNSIDTWKTTADDVPAGTSSLDFNFRSTTDGFFPMAASLAILVGAVEVEKRSLSGDGTQIVSAGDAPKFLIDVTNPSAVTISNVKVSDPHAVSCVLQDTGAAVPQDGSGNFTLDDLEPASTVTLECTGPVVPAGGAGYTNTASVSATDPNGDPLEIVEDDSDVKVAHLTVNKRVSSATVPVGGQVTWTIEAVNDGETDLGDVRIVDNDCAGTIQGPTGPGAASGVLAQGDTWTYTCKEKVTKDKTNTATGTATPQGTFDGTQITGGDVTDDGDARVKTTSTALGRPRIRTHVADSVVKPGALGRDRVTISGLVTPYKGTATARLYGPFASKKSLRCTGTAVGQVRFTARNGTTTTRGIKVTKPGYYTWMVTLSKDAKNAAARHKCGLAAETFMVRKPRYGTPVVPTGFAGLNDNDGGSDAGEDLARRVVGSVQRIFSGVHSGARVEYPRVGANARVVGIGIKNGVASIPDNPAKVGWLKRSAGSSDLIGNTVIAGHVADRSDRPGALWKLGSAKRGQVITVATPGHKATKFKVIEIKTYDRAKPLPASLFSTTGPHRLVLISCTGKVVRPNGRYHYTLNRVVIAKPINQ